LITSAAALLAGSMFAAAQEQPRNQPGAGAGPAQEQKAPQPSGQREQRSPGTNQRAQDQKGQRPATTGQGQRDDGKAEQPKADQQRSQGQRDRDRNQRGENRRDEPRTQGQGERDRNQRGENRRDEPRTQGQGERDRNQREENRRDDRRDQDRNQRNEGRENRDQTQGQGPGRTGGAVNFTQEQRTRIRETVLVRDAPRVSSINFKLNVGVAVPSSVHLVAVPEVIVGYHPAWRGFLYFVYEDEIIIVDPRSHHIVAVLEV